MRGMRTLSSVTVLLCTTFFAGAAQADTAEEIVRAIELTRSGPLPDIRVSVSDGVAIVTGFASTALERRMVTDRLREASNVDEIRNLVVLDRP